jgi:SAM-dependent methyltransferase
MDPSFWDQRYAAEGYSYGREPNDFVRDEAARIPKGRVLCLAEGEGRNAVFLAGLGHAVTALDFSAEGLRKAERLARERGVTIDLVEADLEHYTPQDGVFSGIVSIWAHVPRAIRQRVHRWVPDALAPGGVFLYEAYTPAQIALGTGGPKDPELLPTVAELRQELSPLELVIAREVEREVHEGPFHGGLSATVQVAGVKPRKS